MRATAGEPVLLSSRGHLKLKLENKQWSWGVPTYQGSFPIEGHKFISHVALQIGSSVFAHFR